MRVRTLLVGLVTAAAAPLMAQQHDPSHTHGDSAYAAMQERGAHVMGVDQYTSGHVFEPLPDGGRIALQRNVDDSAGTEQIRRHLAEVATSFSHGDFTAPFLVHAQDVPGTAVMSAHHLDLRYDVRPLPRGGEVRITASDPAVVAAVHDFLAFQRREHRAAEH